ncbi:MAG: glucose 1-dehydrogenase [Deltaproteobacteria bacterium]|nr:glucose 1-dehydrogenase [Deltaproteobacteria bacterium]MBW2444360.1 glucose 1-dehydrogenase [Deltaproteobacteria bacterium]
MTKRLDGQVALITGGASGFGEATARLFVEEGARVLLADVQEERGARVAKELGDAALFQPTDVTQEDAIAAAVDLAVSELGGLDCMFANAGIVGSMGPIEETPIEEYDFTMAVNLRGVFLCMKHAARIMRPQGSGTILSCSSIAGLQGGLGPHAYATAKTALIGLTRNVAAELAPFGVRVNCIAPGNMATPMIAGLVTGDPDAVPAMENALAMGSPLPGRAGRAGDIADAALYLASDASSYVSGHTLVVDAGMTTGSGRELRMFEQRAPLAREAGQRGLPES